MLMGTQGAPTLICARVNQQTSEHGVKTTSAWLEAFIKTPYILERKGGVASEREMTKDTSVGKMGGVNYELVRDLRKALQEYVSNVLQG